jgi:hypothetical protein
MFGPFVRSWLLLNGNLYFSLDLARQAVRHCEQGSRIPEMSARVLLTIIDRDPDYARRALGMNEDRSRRRKTS